MKHDLKSDLDKIKNRGMALDDDVNLLRDKPIEKIVDYLNSDDPVIRTSAAVNLKHFADNVCNELLHQLSKEKSLYTKIAICEALQKGNIDTAVKMTAYLGIIGNNQYKKLPKKVSLKKSYPLPRDIIARTLSKMNINIFPVLLDVLKSDDSIKIHEVIDAIGFMVFYNQILSNNDNLKCIIHLMDKYEDDKILIWKCLTCLSSFNLEKSKNILNNFINNEENILSLEAKRSLSILNKK